jgi:hypothetical protein
VSKAESLLSLFRTIPVNDAGPLSAVGFSRQLCKVAAIIGAWPGRSMRHAYSFSAVSTLLLVAAMRMPTRRRRRHGARNSKSSLPRPFPNVSPAAIDALSRSPLSRAFRPFIGSILKGSSGSICPVRQAVGGCPVSAHSGRPESTFSGHRRSRSWTPQLGGKRAYRSRQGKDRSARQSRHSIPSAKWGPLPETELQIERSYMRA